MIDSLIAPTFSWYLGLGPRADGKPYERPIYETQFACTIALVLSGKEMMKHSLDPNRFKCFEQKPGRWIIVGKQRSEP